VAGILWIQRVMGVSGLMEKLTLMDIDKKGIKIGGIKAAIQGPGGTAGGGKSPG